MCEIIIDGKTVEFEGSVLAEEDLKPYRAKANHIKICDSVTRIDAYAFFEFEILKSIEIPNSVKNIGASAFEDCVALGTLKIPESVQIIGNSTFSGCRALKSIRIPRSVTTIGGYAFYGCKALKSIRIPRSVTRIGEYTFYGCKSLENINIPDSVIEIGYCAFYECDTIRLKINDSRKLLPLKALLGNKGQIVTVDITGDEYAVLTVRNNIIAEEGTAMVITGYVDYAGGKLYSGYEFLGDLNSSIKEPMYCYIFEKKVFYDTTLSGLKR